MGESPRQDEYNDLKNSDQFLSLQARKLISDKKRKFPIHRGKNPELYSVSNCKLLRVMFGAGNHEVKVFGRQVTAPLTTLAELYLN